MTGTEIDRYVEAAAAAARVGGVVLRDHARNLESLAISEKSSNDYVTAADRASEEAIAGFLSDRFPDHSLFAEEEGARKGESRTTWIVDPLDGTTNFIHGYPVYAVSVALRHDRRIVAGAIYDPVREELFRAGAGRGAYLGREPIRVASRTGLTGCLLATGFPFKRHNRLGEYLRCFEALLRPTAGIRRAGSAALDLAYVACGRFDGFWEMSLSVWDIAAGSLIVSEAGGRVSDFSGADGHLDSGNVVAANPRVHSAMLDVIRGTLV